MSGSVVPAPNWVRRKVVSCQPDLGLAAKAAREFSARTLRGWGIPVLADDAAVIVSELVSNAIRHGMGGRNPDGPDGPDGPAYDRIELILWRRSGQIICAVTDPGVGSPALADPDPLAEQGRGLHVVEALSATWGWTRLGDCRKAVWAAMPAPGAEPGRAEAGPHHAAWEWRSRPA